MKHVVILGGGFAGVAAGLALESAIKEKKISVTIVDKNDYHLFTPSLFEVATSEQPQQNVCIPLNVIFGKQFAFVKNSVERIDPKEQKVFLKRKQILSYDYLIIALGSQPAYYGIPGLQDYSVSFKSLKQAVAIKNKIKSMCCKEGTCNKKVQAVIGGGGFSGTELAAELLTYKDRLAKQHKLAPDCLEITIIQGSDRLLKELDSHVSSIAEKRLTAPNVHFAFGGHVKEVTPTNVNTDDGKSYAYDILIWTGGVEANHIAKTSGFPINKRGQLMVTETLQVQGYDNIFSAGDITEFVDKKSQEPAPTVAQVAEEQGKVAAENVLRLIQNKPLKSYVYRHFGYVVPIRGHFAVAELMGGIHFDGFLGWFLEQLVYLRYLLGILPIPKAFMRWNKFEMAMKM